jgi:HTH-type transcriptional regulator / antitoxin HipB
MIRNEHERRTTLRKLVDLETSLQHRRSKPIPRGRNSEMHELACAGLATQIQQLQEELVEYAELTSGIMSVTISFDQIDDLGAELIRARLARGLSQRALADEVGIAEGVIRRYERERYASTSLRRITEIASVLRNGNAPNAKAG